MSGLSKTTRNKCDFKEGMRLEAIDPQYLSTIRVASVARLLPDNYLMIRFDGFNDKDGSDEFCYHRSSACVLPAGFCNRHQIQLQAPFDFKGKFDWPRYLRQTGAEFAPSYLFYDVSFASSFLIFSFLFIGFFLLFVCLFVGELFIISDSGDFKVNIEKSQGDFSIS